MSFSGTRIGVVVRIRPLLKEEKQQGHRSTLIRVDPQKQTIFLNSNDSRLNKKFTFDHVFDYKISQENLFSDCKLDILMKKVIEGYNATIFAYGQTGSGKTYTMEGYPYDKKLKPVLGVSQDVLGITPRSIQSLFNEIQLYQGDADIQVYCNFIQLYKEKIYDLLNPTQFKLQQQTGGLKLRWNKQDEFYVENLLNFPCASTQDAMRHYHQGLQNKVMSSHNLNSMSSRSHCVFTITLEVVDRNGEIITSRLQLIDLAGSERNSLTGNEGKALKEAIEINKSLFTLRQVITALSQRDSEGFIPYRDSKLTSLLKQSIGGNSFCLMIACLSPSDNYFEENLSTLNYATQTTLITNEPVKNVDPRSKIVQELQEKIKSLQAELKQAYQQIDTLTNIIENQDGNRGDQLQQIRNKSASNQYHRHSSQPPRKPMTPSNYPIVQSEIGEHYYLTPELLSEKLHDSVKMIRDLMNTNRSLKETIFETQNARRGLENERAQLQVENQQLRDQLDQVSEGNTTMNNRQEREELVQRIKQLEQENSQFQQLFQTKPPTRNAKSSNSRQRQEWGWKTKRTNIKTNTPSPAQFHYMQERPQDASLNFNLKPFRPLSRPKEQSNIPVRPLDRSMEGLEMESEEFNNSIRRHRGRFAR